MAGEVASSKVSALDASCGAGAGVVRVERHGPLACVVIDNPPLNNATHAVRTGLLAAIRQVADDPDVSAVLLRCQGRSFVSGADIREIDGGLLPPNLPDVITEMEAMAKPVVAALHGFALGGGMEIALGCHARIAESRTRFGFPEVSLGLLPGAGGTQRLPRLVGAKAALDMMLSGRQLQSGEALALGLIDRIASDDLVADAIAMTSELVDRGVCPSAVSSRRAVLDVAIDAADAPAGVDITLPAPRGILRCVRAAVELPFADGSRVEASLFEELRVSAESHALRHLFFAEREVTRLGDTARERAKRFKAAWRKALDASPSAALSGPWMQVIQAAAAESLRADPQATPAEVDVLAVREFGYPRHWGGPWFHSRRLGAGEAPVQAATSMQGSA
jgi:3-hydroxyacyl-CoA dehydrogenase